MIRSATLEDFPAIIEMVREFWKHTQFTEDFDADHTHDMLMLSYDHGLLAVCDDGEVYGFISAIKSYLVCSRQAMNATELGWWVNPEKRGKMDGVGLIRFLESLCISQDVKYLSMAFMETSMPARIARLYESLGYALQETLYTKVLHGSSNSRCNSSRNGSL
jgi:hypothetical protein